MNNFDIKFFENFSNNEKLYEFKLPIVRLDEILSDLPNINDKINKSILKTFYKTYDEYIDCIDKKKHHYKVNDLAGNIINNNRVVIDVIIFSSDDFEKIKENVVEFSVGEFYNLLPSTIDVFGIQMKPVTFMNREKLTEVFKQNITEEMTTSVITNITGYSFDKKFNDFYIWSKK